MIKTITISDAREFLETLRLSHPIWGNTLPGNTDWVTRETWGFRGQSNANWSLIPTAFREPTMLGFRPSSASPTKTSYSQQEQERRALIDFLFFADRIGLEVPGDGPHLRYPTLPGHTPKPEIDAWPWEVIFETLAVAQHHGVPTRLLDFTFDPWVAAFFACYDAWNDLERPNYREKLNDDRKIAVWAVSLPLIYSSVGHSSKLNQPARIILVTAPRAKNSYLHSQEGYFMVDLDADRMGYPPMEDAISDVQNYMVRQGYSEFQSDQIIKVELSWNLTPEVLALLWFEFYNIAKMQPTLDKAVEALRDHRALFG